MLSIGSVTKMWLDLIFVDITEKWNGVRLNYIGNVYEFLRKTDSISVEIEIELPNLLQKQFSKSERQPGC